MPRFRQWILSHLVLIAICLSACSNSPTTFNAPNDKYDGRCSLRLADAPQLRGCKLGMSVQEIENKFPRLKIPPTDDLGYAIVYINADPIPSDPNFNTGVDFQGAENVTLEFLDNRVTNIGVSYKKYSGFKSVDEFASTISKSLNLPPFKEAAIGHSVECYDFRAEILFFENDQQGHLYIKDAVANETYLARKRAKEENERRTKEERERRLSEEKKKVFKP